MIDINEIVNKWKYKYLSDYLSDFNIDSVIYGSLGTQFLGYTIHSKNHFIIYINNKFINDEFTTKVILWHEFAHVMDIVKNGNGGHDKGWIKEWFRKPLMTIPSYIIIFPIVVWRMIK